MCDGSLHGYDVGGLIKVWAEHGRVDLFQPLRESAWWPEGGSILALNVAAGAGTLVQLLMACELPLSTHPALAQTLKGEAVSAIGATPAGARIELDARGLTRPTCDASLVANYLVSDTSAAERLLHKLVEPMVVFRSQEETAEALPMFSSESAFPEALEAIYLHRVYSASPGARGVGHDEAARTLRYGGHTLRTSALHPVTLASPEHRRAALIPSSATRYACVYAGQGLPTGGFLYCAGGSSRNLAINSTGLGQHRHALAFGPFKLLGPGSSDAVERLACEIADPNLLEQGARKDAWLGQGEVDGVDGGFAYIFEDPSINRVFPLLGSGEIVDRAHMTSCVRSSILPSAPNCSEDVQKWLGSKERIASGGKGARKQKSLEVTVARLRARGLLHPLVLRALWVTPRKEAVCSIAAKAIIRHAYKSVHDHVYAEISLQCVSLAGVSSLARSIRSGDFGDAGFQAAGATAAAVVVTCACTIETLRMLFILVGYSRRGWIKPYLTQCRPILLHLSMHFSLLVWMYACHTEPHAEVGRPLAAAAGGIAWVRLLWTCRTLEF